MDFDMIRTEFRIDLRRFLNQFEIKMSLNQFEVNNLELI